MELLFTMATALAFLPSTVDSSAAVKFLDAKSSLAPTSPRPSWSNFQTFTHLTRCNSFIQQMLTRIRFFLSNSRLAYTIWWWSCIGGCDKVSEGRWAQWRGVGRIHGHCNEVECVDVFPFYEYHLLWSVHSLFPCCFKMLNLWNRKI